MPGPRVVIAEDYVLIQETMRAILEPECEVVAALEDGRAALDAVAELRPDVLLVDASLPVMSGFAVAERVTRTYPEVKVIFVTGHADPAYVKRAFEVGAKAYLMKGSIHVELLTAVHEVMAGNRYQSAILSR